MNDFGQCRISPDGRHLAFIARVPGAPFSLRLRPLNCHHCPRVVWNRRGFAPFRSPYSRFLAFTSGGSLKKIHISSGAITTIAAGNFGFFSSWGVKDTLLFSRASGLHSISATGTGAALVVPPEGRANYDFPSFLPDGDSFLFADIQTLVPQRGAATIYVGSLGSKERKELRAGRFASCLRQWPHFVRARPHAPGAAI